MDNGSAPDQDDPALKSYMVQAEFMLERVRDSPPLDQFHENLDRLYSSFLHGYEIDHDASYIPQYLNLLKGFVDHSFTLRSMVIAKIRQTPYNGQNPPNRTEILRSYVAALDMLREESAMLMVCVGRTVGDDSSAQVQSYSDLIELSVLLSCAYSSAKSSLENRLSSGKDD